MFFKIIHEHSKGNEGAVDGVITYPSEHEFTKQHRFVSRLISVLWTLSSSLVMAMVAMMMMAMSALMLVVMMFLMAMFSPDAGKPMGK